MLTKQILLFNDAEVRELLCVFPYGSALFVLSFQFVIARVAQYFATGDAHELCFLFFGEMAVRNQSQLANAYQEQHGIEVGSALKIGFNEIHNFEPFVFDFILQGAEIIRIERRGGVHGVKVPYSCCQSV